MDEEFESLCHFCIILQYTEKRYREKSRYLSWRRRRDSTGFQPVVFALRTVYFMSLFAPQKDGRRVRVSPNKIHIYKKKKHKGKILVLFLAQKERLDGFSTRRVRFANSLFYVPFCSAKRWTKSSSLPKQNSYIQKEKAQRKNPCAFSGAEGETRTLAPVTRPTPLAGAPRHQLEYFCIGSVYDTIRLLKERAENPLSLLSGGESGIRTHGTLPYDGFQDRSVITTSVSLRIRRKL